MQAMGTSGPHSVYNNTFVVLTTWSSQLGCFLLLIDCWQCAFNTHLICEKPLYKLWITCCILVYMVSQCCIKQKWATGYSKHYPCKPQRLQLRLVRINIIETSRHPSHFHPLQSSGKPSLYLRRVQS